VRQKERTQTEGKVQVEITQEEGVSQWPVHEDARLLGY
jgi:hypothetical protein